MATFTFFIRDERYTVPTLAIVVAQSEAGARALAVERLLESAHHTAIDVYEGEALRFSLSPGAEIQKFAQGLPQTAANF